MEEKKESGIAKLWNLLNDYEDYKEKECGYANYDWRLHEISDEEEGIEQRITAFRVDDSELGVEESIAVIICKGYMFVEWLVKNDKIDIKKAKEGEIMLSRNDEENIIGKLSISDTPIEDLISYLK